MYTFILFKISNMTELCCWISRNWACWTCYACCICWACKSSSCFFFNFSSSWRSEISLSCFSEKYEIKSLDVDLRDLFCEPSPASFSFFFLVSSNVSSDVFRIFCARTSSSSTLDFLQLLVSVLQHQLHRTAQSNHVVLHLLQCDWVISQMIYPLLSILTYIFSLRCLSNCVTSLMRVKLTLF